jgi:TctA family transporter
MGPIDALWHLLNLFVPAIGMGLVVPSLAKLVWRRALKPVAWRALAQWVAGVCAVVTVAGLVITGHDGRMATYAAMVVASAAVLWWRGLRRSA